MLRAGPCNITVIALQEGSAVANRRRMERELVHYRGKASGIAKMEQIKYIAPVVA